MLPASLGVRQVGLHTLSCSTSSLAQPGLCHISRRLHFAANWARSRTLLGPPGLSSRTVTAPSRGTSALVPVTRASGTASGMDTAATSAACVGEARPEGSELWQRVLQVYDEAQASGAATKTDTQVHLVRDGALGVEFVVRLAAALRAKPRGAASASASTSANKAATAPSATPTAEYAAAPSHSPPQPTLQPTPPRPAPPVNPFLPYEQALWVAHLSDTHLLLLNKFNVVAHHVLVVTRAFESQQDPLNRRDLEAAWKVLQAMPHGGVAFYNCGPHSGRSQPHKHMQVVPLPLHEGAPPETPPPLQQLALEAAARDQPGEAAPPPYQAFAVESAPYRCYAARLDTSPSPEQLELTFNQLLDAACGPGSAAAAAAAAGTAAASGHAVTGAGSEPSPPPSYNVVLTRELMMVVPRRQETCGPLAINSLGFAGTILVRSEEEVEFVRSHGPSHVLAQVGQPW